MLIEFCCPACCTPLAVKDDVAGGQVNCPNCQKLILIPVSSPFGRMEGGGPFDAGRQHDVETVKRAISISVEPYRRELDSKSNLLNEAVEMVKTRNRRIREIESLILKVQKDLWALEVEYEEESGKAAEPAATPEPDPAIEELETHCRELSERVTKLQSRNQVLHDRLDRALESLAETHGYVREERSLAVEMAEQIESLRKDVPGLREKIQQMETDAFPGPDVLEGMRRAGEALKRCGEEIQRLRERLKRAEETLGGKDQGLSELQRSLEEKTETAQKSLAALEASFAKEREAQQAELARCHEKLEQGQAEQARLQEELAACRKQLEQEAEQQRGLRDELTSCREKLEQGEVDQTRLEQELAEKHRILLELKEADSDKEEAGRALEEALARKEEELRSLEESWKRKEAAWLREQKAGEARRAQLQEELTEQDEKLQSALKNQQTLAEQSLKMENERKDLKRRISDALEKIVELESRG